MATVVVSINGASNAATLTWNGQRRPLAGGAGAFGTSFFENPGTSVYAIVVFGNPSDPWSAKVTDGRTTFNHAGHMSPSGHDTTGDTNFPVSQT
jgi:hypothetical protein